MVNFGMDFAQVKPRRFFSPYCLSDSMLFRLFRYVLPVFIIAVGARVVPAAPPVDFQRDVQTIFAEHCALCHGVDAKDRKSGLRLDVREGALKGGESGMAAIVPGNPEQSELIRRVTS